MKTNLFAGCLKHLLRPHPGPLPGGEGESYASQRRYSPPSWSKLLPLPGGEGRGEGEPIKSVRFGKASRRFAKESFRAASLLVIALLAVTVSPVRADDEQDLISVLQSNADAAKKCDACEKLRTAGTVKAVPAVAALLGEESTAHAARYALEGMPFPEAVAALRQALGTTSGSIKAGLIDSLGWRRDAQSVPLLKQSLSDADATVASAAACALGRIGGKEAVAALTAAREKASPSVQPAALDGLARCADQLRTGGDAKGARAIYRTLFDTKVPQAIRVAAWRGLVLTDAKGREELVVSALGGQERPLHAAALQVLRELDDASLIEACLRRWRAMSADSQLAILDARLKFGGNLLPVIRTATQSPNLAVRVAAWQALAEAGDASTVPMLAKAAASGEPAERDAAHETLTRMRGADVRQAIVDNLAGAGPAEKVELLRALGERCDADAAKVLLENAAGTPEAVRLAALDALRRLANPGTAAPLLKLAASSKSESEGEPVLKALYAICDSSPDKNQTATEVLDAMKPLGTSERHLVLPVLSELATPAALEVALAAAHDQDAESAKEAVRVLAQWPNAAPASSLLELGRGATDPVLRVLALRGCIDVVSQEPDHAKRLELLQQALAASTRPDEKKQALAQLGQLPTPAALRTAMGYVADPELSAEAGLAAVTIAEKVAKSHPKLARETGSNLLAQCSSPEVVRRAWALGQAAPAADAPFIQDWLVCGPYTKPGLTGAKALFDVPFAPEEPDAKVEWKSLPRGNTAALGIFFPEQFNCVAYLRTRIVAARDCEAALLLGSDDGVKAWLNGTVVHRDNVERALVPDKDMAPIRLKQGANELLLKITQGSDGWGACARIVGADGQPIPGVEVQLP